MSWKMEIIRAKPNPRGRDKVFGAPSQAQLLGEWVDLKNIGDQSVNLSMISLANMQFNSACQIIQRNVIYWKGNSLQSLSPGQVVRVHTGKSAYSLNMTTSDYAGSDLHSYAESGGFILNNKCGDTLSVWWWDGTKNNLEDMASYSPNPADGSILIRKGDKLVPSLFGLI